MLREAGIPVESVSGPYGGYRIGRGARIPPLMFSTPEAVGLVMAVLQGWHGSVEADHPAATALAKILRVLPAATAAAAEAMRGVQAQNPGDSAAMPDAELTATITQACENRKRIRLTYRTGSRMLLEPWAVVVRHGRWYLLGWLPDADARRVLRLDRITAVETTDEACTPPDDLDPVSQVEDHLADGWNYPVEVRIDAPLGKVALCIPRTLGRLDASGEHCCALRGSTDEPIWYAEQLAAIPAPFAILTGERYTPRYKPSPNGSPTPAARPSAKIHHAPHGYPAAQGPQPLRPQVCPPAPRLDLKSPDEAPDRHGPLPPQGGSAFDTARVDVHIPSRQRAREIVADLRPWTHADHRAAGQRGTF